VSSITDFLKLGGVGGGETTEQFRTLRTPPKGENGDENDESE
jgi:hypothetical protein